MSFIAFYLLLTLLHIKLSNSIFSELTLNKQSLNKNINNSFFWLDSISVIIFLSAIKSFYMKVNIADNVLSSLESKLISLVS